MGLSFRRSAAGGALLLALLAGCTLERGVVVSKTYHGAYVYTQMIIVSDGKTTTMYPQLIEVPECWGLYLRDGAPGHEDTREGEVCVTPDQFAGLSQGDFVDGLGS